MDALAPHYVHAARPRQVGARGLLALLVVVVALGVPVASAQASVAAEQLTGQKLAEQVKAGARSCKSLSADDLDHIGEFVMGRMIGSTSAHEAMNARMTAAMGSAAESRIHQVLGARFVNCVGSTAGTGQGSGGSMMGGQGMMGSSSGSGGWSDGDWGSMMGSGNWGSMMRSGQWTQMMGSSGDWNWMMGSRWKSMSNADWQRLQQRMLGVAAVRATDNGWSTRDTGLVALIVILAAGLVAWRPWRRHSQ